MIFIDSINPLGVDSPTGERLEKIRYMAGVLRRLAKKLDVPIITSLQQFDPNEE